MSTISDEIWHRLTNGQPLTDLGLPLSDGRVVVGSALQTPVVEKTASSFRDYTVNRLSGFRKIVGAHWGSVDFTGAEIHHLRLMDCNLDNCVFDHAVVHDLRVWGNIFSGCRFANCDLRNCSLGGTSDSRRTAYHRCSFSKVDLRGSTHRSATYDNCRFDQCKLTKVDFAGSVFTDTVFTGDLLETCFHRSAWGDHASPPNEMKNVDLSRAVLRWTEFRNLDLETVLFPSDDDHIVLEPCQERVEQILRLAELSSDREFAPLCAYLRATRKWFGTNQRRCVIHRRDVIEAGGERAMSLFLEHQGGAGVPPA